MAIQAFNSLNSKGNIKKTWPKRIVILRKKLAFYKNNKTNKYTVSAISFIIMNVKILFAFSITFELCNFNYRNISEAFNLHILKSRTE